MRAADDIERMFLMVPWLQQHDGISVQEAARHFGIRPERLVDELVQLSMIGSSTDAIAAGDYSYLIEFDQDEAELGRIRVDPSEHMARPLALSPDQALSLIVALRSMESLVSEASLPHVVGARAKLERMAGQAVPVEVDVASGAPDVREVVHEAIASARRLHLTYDGVNRGRTTYPVVDPLGIVVRGGAAYLQAWSLEPQAWRTFRVDRIAAASLMDVEADDHGPAPDLGERWFEGEQVDEVWIDLAPRGQYLVEYENVREVVETGDPAFPLRVLLPVTGPAYLASRLLRLADAARVVAPEGAGVGAARVAQGALDAYQALFPDDAPPTDAVT